jgi:CheY-like chemotaxis protein
MGRAKILIVDDDADFTEVLKATLESERYNVAAATDRTEGMEKIRIYKPDLIILDVMLSEWSDGFVMSRELKKDPQFKDIPILMLTAVRNRSGIDFKSTAGDPTWCPVDVFLDKPVEPDVLLAEVRKLLPRKTGD